jgi:hypothetical protein
MNVDGQRAVPRLEQISSRERAYRVAWEEDGTTVE